MKTPIDFELIQDGIFAVAKLPSGEYEQQFEASELDSKVEQRNNVKELVRRWNSHNELLEALKELVQPGMKPVYYTRQEWDSLPHIAAARAAIAKATAS